VVAPPATVAGSSVWGERNWLHGNRRRRPAPFIPGPQRRTERRTANSAKVPNAGIGRVRATMSIPPNAGLRQRPAMDLRLGTGVRWSVGLGGLGGGGGRLHQVTVATEGRRQAGGWKRRRHLAARPCAREKLRPS
jgi:hypothetical protein